MSRPYGTEYFRAELGMHTMDTFIFAAVGRLGWNRTRIETDLRSQLMLRLNNAKAANSIADQMMTRFDQKVRLDKLIDKAKDAYKSAKEFDLTPKVIADACSSMLTGLFIIAKVENDLGQDVNPHTPDEEEFWGYLTYSYLTRGRVQPRYSKIF